jgi:predicted nucleic acid-binding Zn ribbon protein
MESLSNLLFSLYQGTPLHDEWMIACLQGTWRELLGEKLAHVCRPLSMRGLELVVEVSDAAWLPALSSMKPELLGRIRSAAGDEVQLISFVPKETA